MGDSSGDCEIEEEESYYDYSPEVEVDSYCSVYYPEVDNYCSEYPPPQVDNSNDKVSWIWNKGWGIGKKLLVTGAVISSAPFVLPPLVVTSAIAFACWVPSGVVLASYACSEKIMSKLLPNNGSGTKGGELMSNNEDEEEFEDADEGAKVDVGEYLDVERTPMLKENHEGSRYEYYDDGVLDENAISDGMDVVVFNVIEDGEEYGMTPIEVTKVVLEESGGQERASDFLGEKEMVEETRCLLEKIRNGGNAAADGMEMDDQYVDGTAESRRDPMDILLDNNMVSDEVDVFVSNVIEGEGEEEIIIEEIEAKQRVKDFMEDEEVVKETRGLLEKIRDAGSGDNAVAMAEPFSGQIERHEETAEISRNNIEETERAVDNKLTDADVGLEKPTRTMEAGFPKQSEITVAKDHVTDANAVSEDLGRVLRSKSSDNTVGAERPIEDISIVHNILEAEKPISDMKVDLRIVSTVVEETHAPAMNKETMLQAERAEKNISQVKTQSIRDKEHVVSTNADARELADESGLHVFDEKNVSSQQDSHTFDYSLPVYEGHVGGKSADHTEVPISSRVKEADAKKSSRKIPRKNKSNRKDDIRSNGVPNNEDKIWKQIEAIRNIIGYKDKPQASYTEELKALYIFTGVEPPTSFDDPPDLAQDDHKLRFLLSIIGLK